MDVLFDVRPAQDGALVADVLLEAIAWMDGRSMPMWRASDVSEDATGFVIAWDGTIAAGTCRIDMTDPSVWPGVDDSIFVHRLAIRRAYAGRGVTNALIAHAAAAARALGRRWVRLDCDASRPRLRAVYERLGFAFVDERVFPRVTLARFKLDVRQHR